MQLRYLVLLRQRVGLRRCHGHASRGRSVWMNEKRYRAVLWRGSPFNSLVELWDVQFRRSAVKLEATVGGKGVS